MSTLGIDPGRLPAVLAADKPGNEATTFSKILERRGSAQPGTMSLSRNFMNSLI
jgi:hypothetical protein